MVKTCLVNGTIAGTWSDVFIPKNEIIVKNMGKDMFEHVLTMFQMLTKHGSKHVVNMVNHVTNMIVDQPTLKKIFLRHGGVIEGTHARWITNRIRNNMSVDATVTFDFEGHFKGHKV